MRKEEIIKAWKDPEFRSNLDSEKLTSLPENPVGKAMDDMDSQLVSGGYDTTLTLCPSSGWVCTISGEWGGGCCNPFTSW